MYKIKHNEIKILQNLKGGSVFSSLGKSSSFNVHPYERQFYSSFNNTGNSAAYGFYLKFGEKDNFNLIRPLFGQEIRFEKFDRKMYLAILLTLSMFYKYRNYLREMPNYTVINGVNGDLPQLNAAPADNEPEKKTYKKKFIDVRKKLIILGISVLKALGLYDHYENKFIEYEDFKKNIGTPADTGDIDLLEGLEDNKSQKELAKSFVDNLVDIDETDVDDPVEIGALANSANDIDGVIKKIQKYIGLTEHGIAITNNTIGDIFNLKKFYNNIKYLYNRYYKEEINCKKIYFRQIFVNPPQPPNPYMLNRRWLLEGGNYDKLDYMLNGGSLNTIVRIPNLSEYFKSQLNIVENRLRVNNKALSEVSKREINQIIDALHEHEKNLKDQFELLKAAHLIDQKEISIKDDADKLKKAKSSLRKHIRYSGALVDIIRTVALSPNFKYSIILLISSRACVRFAPLT